MAFNVPGFHPCLPVVFAHIHESFVLRAKDVMKFALTSKALLDTGDRVATMRNWLRKNEHDGYQFTRYSVVHFYYDACQLQRSFFEALSRLSSPAIIAGSYPAMQHQRRASTCSWAANDIDIWVAHEDSMEEIQKLYHDIVLQPLGMASVTWLRQFYFAEDVAEASRETKREAMVPIRFPHADLVSAITTWCDSYARMSAKDLGVEQQQINDAKLHALRDTILHLPMSSRQRSFRPLRTATIKPKCSGMLSCCLLPINIIQMEAMPGHVLELSPEFVCDGFDLTCCCVCLVVDANRTFRTNVYHGAAEALRKQTLKLRSAAFAPGIALTDIVSMEMRRVLKYLERSFVWE